MNDIDLTGKTVTLVGPMRGQPAFGHPAFDQAADKLVRRWNGIAVRNPAAHDRVMGFNPMDDYGPLGLTGHEDLTELGFDIDKARRWCVARIAESDAVILLPGWQDSEGALQEIWLAEHLNIPRIKLADALAPPAPAPLPEGWYPPDDLLNSDGVFPGDHVMLRFENGAQSWREVTEARRLVTSRDPSEKIVVAWAELSAPPWDPEPEGVRWRRAQDLPAAGLDRDALIVTRQPRGDEVEVHTVGYLLPWCTASMRWEWFGPVTATQPGVVIEPEASPWRPAEELAGAGLDDDAEVLVGWPITESHQLRHVWSLRGGSQSFDWCPIPPYRGGE